MASFPKVFVQNDLMQKNDLKDVLVQFVTPAVLGGKVFCGDITGQAPWLP